MAPATPVPTKENSDCLITGSRTTNGAKTNEKPSGLRSSSERKATVRYGSPLSLEELEDHDHDVKANSGKSDEEWRDNNLSGGGGGARGRREQKGSGGGPAGNQSKRRKQNLSMDELWKKYWKKQEELERLTDNSRKRTETSMRIRTDLIEKTNRQNSDNQEKLEILKSEVKARDDEIKELKQKLLEADQTVHERDVTINAMCNEHVELLYNGDLPAQPDDVVKANLSKLFLRIKKWGDNWSIKSWSPETLEGVCKIPMENLPINFASDRMKNAIQKGKVPPKILVNAFFNGILCQDTFARPLDILKSEDLSASTTEPKDMLQWASNLLQRQSPALKYRLRALCIRSLKIPDQGDEYQLSETAEGHINGLLFNHNDRIIRRVIETIKFLLIGTSPESQLALIKELSDIVEDFVNLFVELDSQYPDIKVRFRNGLMDHGFAIDHSHFTGHRALRLKEDSEDDVGDSAADAGIDGRKIDFVIEPAIIRAGEANGTNYDQTRILLKAVVWMVRPADLKPEIENTPKANGESARSRPAEKESTSKPPAPKKPSDFLEALNAVDANSAVIFAQKRVSSMANMDKLVKGQESPRSVSGRLSPAQIGVIQPSPTQGTQSFSHHIESPEAFQQAVKHSPSAPRGKKRGGSELDRPNKKPHRSPSPASNPREPATKSTSKESGEKITATTRNNKAAPGLSALTGKALGDKFMNVKDVAPRQARVPGTKPITGQERQGSARFPPATSSAAMMDEPDVQIKIESDLDGATPIKTESKSAKSNTTKSSDGCSERAGVLQNKPFKAYLPREYYDERRD